jgi:hypothetical protein
MRTGKKSQWVVVLGACAAIGLGVALVVQALSLWLLPPPVADRATAVSATAVSATAVSATGSATAVSAAAVSATVAAPTPVAVAFDPSVPAALQKALLAPASDRLQGGTGAAALRVGTERFPGASRVYTVTFAAAVRFDTVEPAVGWEALRALWSGALVEEPLRASLHATGTLAVPWRAVAVLTETLPLLTQVLGDPSSAVVGYATQPELVEALWQGRTTLAILPFDQLEPRLAVLAVDGQNPVENSAHFDPARYPLVAHLYAQGAARQLLAGLPSNNRNPALLTVLTMTGVTALCRMTAAQIEQFGPAWPAAVVGPELASADLTHISNEVPFVEGCAVNTDPENFNFCSKPEYMESLWASGVDIVGMTGNHQNDFGRQNAAASLARYVEWGLPYYGGGQNLDEAYAPLYLEHNGNRLAFLGANSYGPAMAWATAALPGAAPFDLAILSATIRAIKQQNRADLVFVELQYQESYDVQPLVDQRLDFNALVRAGADVVTGVQSHVPQAIEFTEGKLVLFGLGNLYFDQMGAQATREGMVVKHTLYAGRHLSTQILTTLLYDYGQPRWSTPEQRADLLERVFGASFW